VPYNFTLATIIPASPQEIYDAWLDSVAHSAMTGSEASMSDAAGDAVSAFDGYISGRNLELVPGERIVQSWRTAEFEEDHPDSLITVTLEDADGGALLTLVHANVPDQLTSYEQGGWEEYYFEPMKAYFSAPEGRGKTKKASAKPRAKRKGAAKKATKPKRKATKAVAAKKSRTPRNGKKAKVKRATGAKRRARRR
jgi:uncharacterized protein YndB with AHSA1/START domain